jgi:hypothetical protein
MQSQLAHNQSAAKASPVSAEAAAAAAAAAADSDNEWSIKAAQALAIGLTDELGLTVKTTQALLQPNTHTKPMTVPVVTHTTTALALPVHTASGGSSAKQAASSCDVVEVLPQQSSMHVKPTIAAVVIPAETCAVIDKAVQSYHKQQGISTLDAAVAPLLMPLSISTHNSASVDSNSSSSGISSSSKQVASDEISDAVAHDGDCIATAVAGDVANAVKSDTAVTSTSTTSLPVTTALVSLSSSRGGGCNSMVHSTTSTLANVDATTTAVASPTVTTAAVSHADAADTAAAAVAAAAAAAMHEEADTDMSAQDAVDSSDTIVLPDTLSMSVQDSSATETRAAAAAAAAAAADSCDKVLNKPTAHNDPDEHNVVNVAVKRAADVALALPNTVSASLLSTVQQPETVAVDNDRAAKRR